MAEQDNLFTGMFSLLRPAPQSRSTLSYALPHIDFESDSSISSISHFKPKFHELDEEAPLSGDRREMSCQHTDRRLYAKNMCSTCYHIYGRSRYAWECPHTDRKMYALGKCHECYLEHYYATHKRRRRS
jgi:hypothetical protein